MQSVACSRLDTRYSQKRCVQSGNQNHEHGPGLPCVQAGETIAHVPLPAPGHTIAAECARRPRTAALDVCRPQSIVAAGPATRSTSVTTLTQADAEGINPAQPRGEHADGAVCGAVHLSLIHI